MLYLEDYLEVIEHLPQELRDRFTEMREMDLQVHNAMDGLDEQVKQFFANAKKMKPDQKDAEYARIKQEYFKTLEDAEEKVHMANQICELVEKYSRRLDQEIKNFTMELEADNPGRAEVLKATSLELDNPPHQAVNHVRERRKHSMHNSSQLSNSISNAASHLAASTAGTANGNPLVSSSLTGSAATTIPASVGAASVIPHPSPLGYIGAGNTAIAAAASQAIAATQQMQQGRRTASLKASYEFVNAGLQTISCDFNPLRDSSMSNAVNSGILSNGEGASAGLHRATKRSRTSSQFHDTDESSEAGIDANGEQIDWNFDPNEPRYCLCNQVSYGDMVACDNEDCQYEWFHYGCVGITQPPKGKWFCPPCTNVMKKKSRKS